MDSDVSAVAKALIDRLPRAGGTEAGAFAVRIEGGQAAVIGAGEPVATLVVKDRRALDALRRQDALAVGQAYLAGSLDVHGDMSRLLALRDVFHDRHPLRFLLRFVRPRLLGQAASDRDWIARHYDEDPDFYLTFLDKRHRAYSQAVFASEDDSLEDAMTRKLDFSLDAIEAKPGDRVLDIGAGWGAFTEYAGSRGVRVTSLTVSEPSRRFVQDIIDRDGLPCRVLSEHFLDHRTDQPYDAIVNLGVTEHLPDYAGTLAHYQRLLKPGGKVYLDASATRRKYDVSTFFERYIFPGNGSPLCLHDYIACLSRTPLQVEAVLNDRLNYMWTTRHWAESLDRNRESIEARWGLAHYRRFQLYLWGCVDGFRRDLLQAYRIVLRRP
jgi:cyclopropane-fatty-acyl-phospholipid synthase